MANAPIIRNGLGNIDLPPVIENLDTTLSQWLRKLAERINGLLSLGDSTPFSQFGNFNAQYLPITFNSVADTDEIIPHGLGRVPVGFLVSNRTLAGTIYAPTTSGWTPDQIVLRSSVASVTATIVVW